MELIFIINGRHGGLMIIALVCGSRGLGSRPGWVTELCSWEKYFTLTMPLSTQENPVNCHLLGGNLVMTGIPWRGGEE